MKNRHRSPNQGDLNNWIYHGIAQSGRRHSTMIMFGLGVAHVFRSLPRLGRLAVYLLSLVAVGLVGASARRHHISPLAILLVSLAAVLFGAMVTVAWQAARGWGLVYWFERNRTVALMWTIVATAVIGGGFAVYFGVEI